MKRSIYYFLIALFYLSCTCEDHETLLNEENIPNPFFVHFVDYNSDEVIIYFNKNLKEESIELGESVLIDVENSVFDGDIIIEPSAIRLIGCDFSCADPSCMVTITLLGGVGGIKSFDGQQLDGDKDGTDGGDYVTEQVIDTCDPLSFPIPCVVSPAHLSTVSYDYCSFDSEPLIVSIEFSETMNSTSINDLNLSIVSDPNNTGDPGFVDWSWNQDSTQLDIYFQPLDCHNCLMDITLFSDPGGIPPITSSQGEILDGDKDGFAGGNYTFTIIINETPTYVVSPESNQMASSEFLLDFNMGLAIMSIDIEFSQPMDTLSANSQSVTLTFDGAQSNVTLAFDWNSDGTILNLRTVNDVFLDCTSSCFYTLKINEDTGMSFMTDQSGVRLDGNRDCSPGGLYTTTFFY